MIRDPSDDIQRVNAGSDSSRRARPRWLKQTLSEHAPRIDRYRAAAVNEFWHRKHAWRRRLFANRRIPRKRRQIDRFAITYDEVFAEVEAGAARESSS
jgi:hypothetical protein